MKYFKSHGSWWLPSDPDTSFSGSLSFSKDNDIILEIIGTFGQKTTLFSQGTIEIIHGFIQENIVTLFSCTPTHQQLKMPSQVSTFFTTYSVRVAILGEHLSENIETATFEKALFDYTYFSHWANLARLSNIPQINEQQQINRVKFDFLLHDHLTSHINGSKFRILQCFKDHPSDLKYTAYFYCLLEISFGSQMTLENIYSNYLSPMQSFLDFATQKTNYLTLFQIFHKDKKLDVVISELKCEEEKSVKSRDFLFTLADIEPMFSTVISRWLGLYKDMPDILNLYFSAINNNSLYVDNQFLFISQSLEGYHRRKIDGNSNSETSLEIRIGKLFEKYKFILEGLTTEYEKQNPGCSKQVIKKISGNISKKVGESRNYQSHLYDRPQENILHGEKLFRVTQILELLFESILLTECGFSAADVERKITENSEFTYLKSIFRSLDFLNS